jgi:hypothetical protein
MFSHLSTESLVLRPSLRQHLPDFGEGSNVQTTPGDDIHMGDDFADMPMAHFEEAEGDEAYLEAVKEAVADHQYVTYICETICV